jgi:probable rRNA maturation factor
VKLALEREGHGEAEISITFLADDPILALNRRWLEHDWVPDVLSFPLHPPAFEGERAIPMGDIYIGMEQAERQARENGVPYDEELLRLAIHGTLHLLGYDHTDEEARLGGGAHFIRQEELVRQVLGP